MSRIEWRHDRRRIVLPVSIMRPETADMTRVTVTALVDTGASTSGITKSVAEQLDLAPAGKRPLLSARAIVQVERYLFRIGIESPSGTDSPAFPFVFDVTLGFELGSDLSVDPTRRIDAVVGMDVLSECDFSIDRTGRCKLDFG